MFRQRLWTSLILIPLVLITIYFANYWIIAAIIALLILVCTYEWLQLVPVEGSEKLLFFAGLILACCLIQWTYLYWLILGLGLWLFILVIVIRFPESQRVWGYPWVVAAFCLILLPLFGQSLLAIFLLPNGRSLFVYLLFLVWAADIGAYLAGKRWGKHKLIPAVSPGKTFEGVLGGFSLTLVVSLIGYGVFRPHPLRNWFIITIMVMFISLLGDLFISILKRRTNIKDTGNILPGHGGILDRLDSLIAAAPVFYSGMHFLIVGS